MHSLVLQVFPLNSSLARAIFCFLMILIWCLETVFVCRNVAWKYFRPVEWIKASLWLPAQERIACNFPLLAARGINPTKDAHLISDNWSWQATENLLTSLHLCLLGSMWPCITMEIVQLFVHKFRTTESPQVAQGHISQQMLIFGPQVFPLCSNQVDYDMHCTSASFITSHPLLDWDIQICKTPVLPMSDERNFAPNSLYPENFVL